ncbi:DUF1642 domain-containing protein [Lacticaseibacillus absianus]|uniref:DUF1642 domain-containing protein n=1 Tax=Lacticaseibacillus absianus TaxID=2729623 RepID=UPI0015CE71C2|nr:DUF1642 domain-containing protein [Lacticaseibacillus absianus]
MSSLAVQNEKGEWLSYRGGEHVWGPYATGFPNGARAQLYADMNGGHVVKLTEEQKVKLPREVGEELDEYKRGFEHDIDVLDLLADVDMSLSELLKTNKWIYDSDGDRSDHANRIIDAYRYGWEDEPEAKWYVQTPKEWWEDKNKPECFDLDSMGISDGLKCKEYAAQFTRAELKKYHFDSDIFTLVPVGESK